MGGKDIEIRCVNEWTVEEIYRLYLEAGWWRDWYEAERIPAMISGSFVFAVALDLESGRAVGMGRVISDGVSDAYLQDLYVMGEFRGLGIGKRITESLLSSCRSAGIEWIGVIAEPGSEDFYIRFGFGRLEGHLPMILGRDAPSC